MSTGDSDNRRRVTLREIAHRANVSAATVSRVLNNHPHVDEATRAIVWKTTEELAYPLDNLRRAAAPARSVVLLVRDDGVQFAADINALAGIERAVSIGAQSVFEAKGIATYVHRPRIRQEEIQQYANNPGAEGLILIGGIVDHEFVRSLQGAGVPFVIAGAPVHPLEVNCVMANVAQGMEQAVNHLASRGRQRIGLVNGPSTTTTSAEKFKGLRLSLCLNGLSFAPAHVVEGDFSSESGYIQTLQLLAQAPDVDAILYAHDDMAVGGLSALKERGRRVPDDVAVVGFHDFEVARFTDPSLTSVHFDMRLMGVMAARRLCAMLDEPDDQAWFMVIPTSLVVRGST